MKNRDAGTKQLVNDIVRLEVLTEEIEYYRSLIKPTDCGFIHTTINFLERRIENLKGKKEWPFND